MIIDAHHHLWRYTPEEFDWIDDGMSSIRRDFGPADLAPALAECGVDGTVAVQARQTLEETTTLLDHARTHHFIKGVVGWVPLVEAAVADTLDRLKGEGAFKGVRHVLQGEPDSYMDQPAFDRGLVAVAARGLTYDLLIRATQLPTAIRLVDRHPDLPIVLDHIAKPCIAGAPPQDWRDQMTELAKRPHVSCKFSGLVTEVPSRSWTPALLGPYFDVALEAFGPDRLMFGSDWPVCLVASTYTRWYRFVADCVAQLAPAERALVLGGTATRVYRLSA